MEEPNEIYHYGKGNENSIIICIVPEYFSGKVREMRKVDNY